MKELNSVEINAVSGGDFEGLVWGVLDGLATGVTVGGSASRSAVFGPVAQGVGAYLGGSHWSCSWGEYRSPVG
jgi:hypothetical protein